MKITKKEVFEEDGRILKWIENFRCAADYVAADIQNIATVQKIALIGSLASEPRRELSEFGRFRKAGIHTWHIPKDIDLAVWLSDLGELSLIRKTIVKALERLLSEKTIGVASHQIDVFIIGPGTNRYLGRLCGFSACPKQKIECLVDNCGKVPFLKQHVAFSFSQTAISPENMVVLFDRTK